MAFATFKKNGVNFQMIYREGAVTYDVVVVTNIGGVQASWGGGPDDRSVILEDVDDAKILAKGSLYAFMDWCRIEAERRADLHSKTFLPDPNDRVARLLWNMENSVTTSPDGASLSLRSPPLP